MGKKIIALIGKDSLVKNISFELQKKGFTKISVVDQVKSISKHFLSEEELKKDIMIKKVRDNAYKINRHYWINILLSSIKDNDYIVIEDMQEEDVIKDVMEVYRVSDNNFEDVKKNIFS